MPWSGAPPQAADRGFRTVCPVQARTPFVDIPIAGPLLSSTMSVIAQAIADRQSEIDRLQAEIKPLTDVEQPRRAVLRHFIALKRGDCE